MMSKKIVISLAVLLLAYFYYGWGKYKDGETVGTGSGKVRGSMSVSRDGREFYQWLGVPYAQPPIGQLRFASPKPIESWEGVKDTSRYGPSCPHIDQAIYFVAGQEDCLHVNIYTPKLAGQDDLLPVMVYFHGGAWVMGSGKEYGPDYFMDEDVVLVTVNYRYGVLGFLSTGDKQIRGNMGLKDQAEALRWLNKNIQFFGGDPNKITIFGESAGGASVHYLTLSSKTKGLFQKAMSLSGTAILPWSFTQLKTTVRQTEAFAQKLNCPLDNSTAITECLRRLDLSTLMQGFKKDSTELFLSTPSKGGQPFTPTVELVSDEESFLNHKPYDVMLQGQGHNIPWMTGGLQDEGLLTSWEFYRDKEAMSIVESDWEENMKRTFSLSTTFSPNIAKQTAKKLREFYFKPSQDVDGKNELTVEEKLERYTQLYTDGMFLVGMSEAASIQREFSPVYLYMYARHGGPSEFSDLMATMKRHTSAGPILELVSFLLRHVWHNYILRLPPVDYGVGHAADLGFLFPLKGFVYLPKDEKHPDYRFSKDLVRLIVSFAKDEKSMEFRNTKFTPTDKEGPLMYLSIDEQSEMIPEPFSDRTSFWRSLNYAKLFSNLR